MQVITTNEQSSATKLCVKLIELDRLEKFYSQFRFRAVNNLGFDSDWFYLPSSGSDRRETDLLVISGLKPGVPYQIYGEGNVDGLWYSAHSPAFLTKVGPGFNGLPKLPESKGIGGGRSRSSFQTVIAKENNDVSIISSGIIEPKIEPIKMGPLQLIRSEATDSSSTSVASDVNEYGQKESPTPPVDIEVPLYMEEWKARYS